MAIKKELLDILACPKCRGKLELDDSDKFLICNNCRLQYPIENDIPVMLVEKALKLD